MFWNEFQTEKPLEIKEKKSRCRNDPTPKSSHRRRKGISMTRDSIKASPKKQGGTKRKLKFEDRNLITGKNPLNLPYNDSDAEQEMEKTQDDLQIEHDQN